jgi:hypothetical protein
MNIPPSTISTSAEDAVKLSEELCRLPREAGCELVRQGRGPAQVILMRFE